jgi:hypothetical protein
LRGAGYPVTTADLVARSAAGAAATLRAGIIDSSYDSMPLILHEVQARYSGLVIHQVEASVPGRYQQLIDGHLDAGIGRAALAPPHIALLLSRQDPLGVLVPAGHRFAGLEACRPRIWPPSRCCSPKKCGPRSSTSSPR